jgi:transposase
MNTPSSSFVLSLLPRVEGLCVAEVQLDAKTLTLSLSSTQPTSLCPLCQTPSTRVHSHYQRTLGDLPWGQHTVRVHLGVRRFRCAAATCPRRIFTERLPTFVAPHARQTARRYEVLRLLAVALGGEAGARLSGRLGLATSPATLLRLIRRTPLPPRPTPVVIGIDDFALRRGQRYGTVIIDLTTHRPVDLLPERTAESVGAWLAAQDHLAVVCRDRSTEYARAIALGAPTAVEVLDRWHVYQNAREALERVLGRYQHVLGTVSLPQHQSPDGAPLSFMVPPRSVGERTVRRASRERRLAHYEAVRALYAQGQTLRDSGRQVGLSRWLVRRYAAAETFPERGANRRDPGMLGPYLPYLSRRWAEGCHNGMQLWRELREQGYPGSRRRVAQWVQQHRQEPAPPTPQRYRRPQAAPAAAPSQGCSPRRVAWLLLRDPATLRPEEKGALTTLGQTSREIALALQLMEEFVRILRQRRPDALPAWFAAAAEADSLPELQTFAAGLAREEAPLRAALVLPWSNGPTEGGINKITVIKRQMYGRGKLDLLRHRVLLAS